MSNTTKGARDGEQLRERTGLRTLDGHESAHGVYWLLGCQYAGVHVLDEKRRLRADASSQHAQTSGERTTAGATGSGERAGESEVSL